VAMQKLIPRTLGILLLAAAGLKLHGLGVAPLSAIGWFSTAWFQVGLIVAEVVLGMWLVSGLAPLGSWALCVATFGGFAAFSFYQGLLGQSSCGCFGRLSVSPWYAFILDLAVLTGLGFGRPDLKAVYQQPTATLKPVLLASVFTVGGVLLFAGLLFGTAHFAFGSVPAAVAYFRGERISIEPSVADVGAGAQGESKDVAVTLTNWTDQPIQVFGGTANCSCTVLGDLPVLIPAMESRLLSVQVHFKGSPGIFTRKAAFLVKNDGFKRVEFPITGRINGTASAGS
jgi:hypothetical protein